MPVSHSSVAERPLAVSTLLVRPHTPTFDNEASVRAQYDIETTKIPLSAIATAYRH
jgi:hypothetical protein